MVSNSRNEIVMWTKKSKNCLQFDTVLAATTDNFENPMYEREHQPLNNIGPGATGNLHVINNLRPEKDTVNLDLAKLGNNAFDWTIRKC